MNFEDMPAASVLTMKIVYEKRRLRLLKAVALGLLSGGLVEDDTLGATARYKSAPRTERTGTLFKQIVT